MANDTRTFRRIGAAALMPIGPLAVAVLRGVMPYDTTSDSQTLLSQAAAGLGRMDAVLWLTLAMTALFPATLAATRLTQRRAPVLSLIAVVLLIPAWAGIFFAAGDPAIRALASGGVDPATGAKLLDALMNQGPVVVATGVFVLGHIAGLILLGAAMWRARAVPVWAAVALIASQPLHFVFAVIVPNHLLDALAWGLAALALGVAAVKMARTSNDDWDVAPAV